MNAQVYFVVCIVVIVFLCLIYAQMVFVSYLDSHKRETTIEEPMMMRQTDKFWCICRLACACRAEEQQNTSLCSRHLSHSVFRRKYARRINLESNHSIELYVIDCLFFSFLVCLFCVCSTILFIEFYFFMLKCASACKSVHRHAKVHREIDVQHEHTAQ